uniref:C2H2-type domain-containing protein n=1 Tax=Monopterus albus TaxID=43700 RepID=A0A3Q3IB95_MONAL
MSLVQYLREFVTERLTAAAEEIFGVFEKTVVEYEEEIDRQRRLLDIVWKPEVKLHRIGLLHRNHSQEGEQLGLKQETDPFMLTPTYEERDHSEAEPTSDQQLLSHSSAVAESQDHGDSGSASNAEPERRHHKDTSQSNSVDNSPLSETHCKSLSHRQPFLCDTCGKDFLFRSVLKIHLRSHTGERPYSCETCGKKFKHTSNLNAHLRIHNGRKSTRCHSNSVDKPAMSETHCDTHTGKKTFRCGTCDKTFRCKSELNKHLRVHSGERPYFCKTCRKGFKQSSALNVHLRIHTGEMPYSCEICGRAFRFSSAVLVHRRNVHSAEK